MQHLKQTPYIIVFGNEKGGTGKSTLAMHVLVHLLDLGFSVGSLDVDARQGTLTRYLENRERTLATKGYDLKKSKHLFLLRSEKSDRHAAQQQETQQFAECLKQFEDLDFIIIDTPGSDTYLSRLAHSYAHTLITSMNDSLIDFDLLARVNRETQEIESPSTYAEMVWDQRKQRALRGDRSNFDWIVVRNRLSNIHSKNKVQVQELLTKLSRRIGFRVAEGFGERVVFRELFLLGVTVLDLEKVGIPFSLSHVAARQELRRLLAMIKLPLLEQKLALESA